MIVLDLADVGTGGGTRTLDLCRELKAKHPQIELIAGGGVRNLDDLKRIADAGCSGALVASALHDGRLTRADWDAAAKL
jgi:phosphoribosylformimino-5-aminoimidazole carboxamide ribotide isomerase